MLVKRSLNLLLLCLVLNQKSAGLAFGRKDGHEVGNSKGELEPARTSKNLCLSPAASTFHEVAGLQEKLHTLVQCAQSLMDSEVGVRASGGPAGALH